MPKPESVLRALPLLIALGSMLAEPGELHAQARDASQPQAGTSAQADAAYQDLSELLGAGKDGEAARAAVTLADRFPESPYAADALFSAAKLYEERLHLPAEAIAAYERIASRYPNSRVALASERRLARLRQNLGQDGSDDALRRWTQIRFEFASRSPEDSIALAETLVAQNPEWPGRAEVYLWLGEIQLSERQAKRARRAFEQALAAAQNTEQRYEAQRGLGTTHLQAGEYEAARRSYSLLEFDGSSSRAEDRQEALRSVDIAELRDQIYVASLGWMLLVALAFLIAVFRRLGLNAGAQALGRPPFEALYLLPIVALLALISLSGHSDIGPAVVIIGIAGISFTWLLGVLLRDAEPRVRLLSWLWTAGSVSAVFASIYVALHRTRLIDLVVATVRFGPDH